MWSTLLRISKILSEHIFKKKEYIVCAVFGGYIAAVLWITLFSRIGQQIRELLLPFYSYGEIINGNLQFLYENIANVILFAPLGIMLECVGTKKLKNVLIIAFIASLLIETSQAVFSLGTFECDDLLHNTIGAIIGFRLAVTRRHSFRIKLNIKSWIIIMFSVCMWLSIPYGTHELRHLRMVKMAAMNDREDGTKNLLVLNGENGKAWDTEVSVYYLQNGSIRIKGTSNKKSWWPLGKIILNAGSYSFSGLTGVDKETVGLEIEKDNQRFIPDVGPVDEVSFTLDKTTELKVYVIVYEGCNCDVTARPAIYEME